MKASYYVGLILWAITLSCYAEVFKCQSARGKTTYQTMPCSSSVTTQRVLELNQRTPEEQALAKEKLRSWQDEQNLEESARLQAARDRQLEAERQEALALQRRSVIAQEQQAIAVQQQNQQKSGGLGYPYYAPCSGASWGGYHLQNRYQPECDPRYRHYPPMSFGYYPSSNQWSQPSPVQSKPWSGQALIPASPSK